MQQLYFECVCAHLVDALGFSDGGGVTRVPECEVQQDLVVSTINHLVSFLLKLFPVLQEKKYLCINPSSVHTHRACLVLS